MKYIVEFIYKKDDYVSDDFIITCWHYEVDGNTPLDDVINGAYEYMEKKHYAYFFIHDGNINHVFYDSKKDCT